MDRVRIKETAKNLLKKNHWLCVGVGLIVSLLGGSSAGISSSFNFNINTDETGTVTSDFPFWQGDIPDESILLFLVIFVGAFLLAIATSLAISAFVGSQVKVGSCRFFLKFRKNHPVEVGELFKSYTDKTFLNVAKVSIIKNLSIFLWSMLCIVPGIIKTYEYAAVDYILSVNPTMEYPRALDLSKKIMNGHKLELFELYISFLGWHILSILTCGLLSIFYVAPYQMIAEAEFFSYVRELAIFNGTISYNDIPDYEEYIPHPPMYQGFAPNGSFYGQPINVGYTPAQPAESTFTPVQPVAEPVAEPVAKPVTEQAEAPVDASAEETAPQVVTEPEPIEEIAGEKPDDNIEAE